MSSSPDRAANSIAPSLIPDLPASVVITCIYFTFAVCAIIRLRQSHQKFRVGALLIGLCMSRVVTFSLRSAWSASPTNKNLAIAATVFLNAGVVLLIVTNMQLLIRIVKSLRPEVQQSRLFTRATTYIQLFIIPLLIMTIVPAIQNILTTNPRIKAQDSIVIKISSTYIAAYASLPFVLAPLVLFTVAPSRRSIATRIPWKVALVMFVSALVGLEQCLRCGNNFNPAKQGVWYNRRYSFYLLTPFLELLCIVALLVVDLPHAFGDSNSAVLDVLIRGDDGDVEESKSARSHENDLREALQATTTTWKPKRWTVV